MHLLDHHDVITTENFVVSIPKTLEYIAVDISLSQSRPPVIQEYFSNNKITKNFYFITNLLGRNARLYLRR